MRRGEARDGGSATVELAALLPAVALLLATLAAAAQWAVAAVAAQSAASTAARVAVSDGVQEAREAARRLLGDDATVVVEREGDWLQARVSLPAVWGLVVSADGAARAQ